MKTIEKRMEVKCKDTKKMGFLVLWSTYWAWLSSRGTRRKARLITPGAYASGLGVH